ncbi:hypothetical protein Trydic_g23363 [Trypoxylus dichotomus]
MSTKPMKRMLLFDVEACGVVVTTHENLGNVCWITQLVVCREFRRKGIATKLIKVAFDSDYFPVCGLVTSHPYTIRALEKATSSICNRTSIEKHSNELIRNSSLPYIDHNMIVDGHGSINTRFDIDHTVPLQIIQKEKKSSR